MSNWISTASEQTFEQQVIDRSQHVPVLVDFWAPWCGPCRTLTPLLEQAVNARDGAVELVKINTDENTGLAQAFNIRGIPAVKAFYRGKLAGEFVGVRDRPTIDAFLDSICPSAEAQALADARRALDEDPEQVAQLVAPLLEQPAHRDEALLLVARAAEARGLIGEARAALDQLPEENTVADAANALRTRLELRDDATSDLQAARRRVESDPDDSAARWSLAGALQLAGETEDALEQLLELLQRDRRYREDGARRAMLALFETLDSNPDLVHDFRRRMQIYL